jgi:L-asparaginase
VVEVEGALRGVLADCFPGWGGYGYLPLGGEDVVPRAGDTVARAMGMSGTGNGDSFLRINAVRTVSAIAKYRGDGSTTSLGEALREVTGPGGELQKSAGKRWKKTGEGEGGMIGIECAVVKGPDGEVRGRKAYVLAEYNCGGMFRATVNEDGKAVARVWNEGQYEGLEGYENEGKEYDLRDLKGEKA